MFAPLALHLWWGVWAKACWPAAAVKPYLLGDKGAPDPEFCVPSDTPQCGMAQR